MRTMRAGRRFTAAIAVLASVCSSQLQAQSDFPSKPVRIILPYASGGKNDVLTRLVGEQLQAQWGERLITESRPGANGRLAYETVARSAPDGYTLVSAVSSLATLPYLYKKLEFDPRRELIPVTQMFQNQSSVVIDPSIPARTVREFVAWVKANPDKPTYFGTQGQGNVVHMVFEMLNRAGGVKMSAIHYKGTADVNVALQRGDVQASLDSLPPISRTPQGTPFRVLAVLTDQRVPEFPDVPTLMESGLFENAPTSWVGLMAPAGTPKGVVDKIARDMRTAMRNASVAEKFKAAGAVVVASSPEEFGQKLQSEYRLYADLVKLVGIEAQ